MPLPSSRGGRWLAFSLPPSRTPSACRRCYIAWGQLGQYSLCPRRFSSRIPGPPKFTLWHCQRQKKIVPGGLESPHPPLNVMKAGVAGNRLSVRPNYSERRHCCGETLFLRRYTFQVFPSGQLKVGKDYRVAQAAAGGTFCVTREANGDDAAHAVEGLHWMKAVSSLAHT